MSEGKKERVCKKCGGKILSIPIGRGAVAIVAGKIYPVDDGFVYVTQHEHNCEELKR